VSADRDIPVSNVSIVVCAYTVARWETLRTALEAARRQEPAPLEIIVVADHAPDVETRARAEFPWAVVLGNTQERGLSGARNSGVAVARGEFIAFLDDDAIPEPGWLAHLTAPLTDPGVMGSGGKVVARWPGERPRFLPPEFDWTVGCSYRGLPVNGGEIRNPIGANMCFRREVFDIAGGFHGHIGRIGTLPVGCEETELCIRFRQLEPATRFVYEPRAVVHHVMSPDRTRWRYFRSRCWSEGLSKAVVAHHAGARDGLSSERSYVLRTLPSGVAREVRHAVRRRDPAGLQRAGAIIAGVAITTAGYARERGRQACGAQATTR